MRRLFLAAMVLSLSPLTAACSDDCQRLADLACQKSGEGSEECKKIQEQADSPSAEDKEACTLALKVVDEFVKQP